MASTRSSPSPVIKKQKKYFSTASSKQQVERVNNKWWCPLACMASPVERTPGGFSLPLLSYDRVTWSAPPNHTLIITTNGPKIFSWRTRKSTKPKTHYIKVVFTRCSLVNWLTKPVRWLSSNLQSLHSFLRLGELTDINSIFYYF